jgi:hypothetical protein
MTLSQFKSIVQSSFLQMLLVGASLVVGPWLFIFGLGFLASFYASAWNASTKAFDAVGNIIPSLFGLLS